ncbi:alpha-1,6-mannosyl-glycoprotein 2-beta-N-acetylglucosaminyltransferase-like [Haemaphysalis longicornis]
MGWVTRLLRRGRPLRLLALACLAMVVWLQARLTLVGQLTLGGDEAPAAAPAQPNLTWTLFNNTRELEILREYVAQLNQAQTVHNVEEFGPLEKGDPVIVIQVHNRWHYLLSLLDSLRTARDINRTLLIFSHDEYSPIVESLPYKVDFCKMMQIFLPHAIQLYPNQFPGQDPKDCPRDIKKDDALRRGCNNAEHPDSFGHYREAKFSQTKHHWWWKMNRVMDGLNITKDHDGPFILLEEDHYAAPDFLHVLRLMEAERANHKECSMLVLGTYVKAFNYHITGNQVEILKWSSSKHNMGMVLYRDLWVTIRNNCSNMFCHFDDYNWDWSLYRISMVCLPTPIQAMVVKSTRVFHTGECGVHHRSKNCSSQKMVQQAKNVIGSARSHLFPKSVQVKRGVQRNLKPPKGNGGWGDVRDHHLCLKSGSVSTVHR